jgi:hypothetical protein
MRHTRNMRRRRWIAIFVLGGLVLLLVVLWPQSEPRFQNKPLSYWLRGFEGDSTEIRLQSAEAVRHIGTNALPLVLKKLAHKPSVHESRWKQSLREWLSNQSLIKASLSRPGGERREALAALDALGADAKSAIPDVEKLLHESPPDPRAPLVLARLGPDAVPVLTSGLTNNERIVRLGCRVSLNLLQSHSEVLFPPTPEDADFARRSAQFNLLVLQGSFAEYRSGQLEPYSPGQKPPSSLPPGVTAGQK